MKKLFFALFILLSFLVNGFSQAEDDGEYSPLFFTGLMLQGSYNNQYQETANVFESTFSIDPQFGYYFTERFGLGLMGSWQLDSRGSSSWLVTSENRRYSHIVKIGPVVRSRFPVSEKLRFVIQATISSNYFADIRYFNNGTDESTNLRSYWGG